MVEDSAGTISIDKASADLMMAFIGAVDRLSRIMDGRSAQLSGRIERAVEILENPDDENVIERAIFTLLSERPE